MRNNCESAWKQLSWWHWQFLVVVNVNGGAIISMSGGDDDWM